MIPGEYLLGDGDIEANAGRLTRQFLPGARVQAADASIQPIEFHGLSPFEVRAWTS